MRNYKYHRPSLTISQHGLTLCYQPLNSAPNVASMPSHVTTHLLPWYNIVWHQLSPTNTYSGIRCHALYVLQVLAQRVSMYEGLRSHLCLLKHQAVDNKQAGWRIIPEDYDTNLSLKGHLSPSPPCLLNHDHVFFLWSIPLFQCPALNVYFYFHYVSVPLGNSLCCLFLFNYEKYK